MWGIIAFGGIAALIIFFVIKGKVWDAPHLVIDNLKNDIIKLQLIHKTEILLLDKRLNNNTNIRLIENEFADIVIGSAWKEIAELCNKNYAFLGVPESYIPRISSNDKIIDPVKKRFSNAVEEQYKYRYLVSMFPELAECFSGTKINSSFAFVPDNIASRSEILFDVVKILSKNPKLTNEIILLKNRINFLESSSSNLYAIPYMAGIMADYETYGLENLAKELDWGYATKRMDKIKSIREIRKDANAIVEKNKESQYQLAYLLSLFPNLEDVIDCEFKQLPLIDVSEISEYDSVRDYISKEEYSELDEIERNQLALDRYRYSHGKTKWQIGRDYELYVGHKYLQLGFEVDYFGSNMGLQDLGRDLIAKKGDKTLIIQCKYWSSIKQIHEKHILQLYGTMVCYYLENHIEKSSVKGILVTNIKLSDMAKKMADYLKIEYRESFASGEYPCIKCNIGYDEYGKTRIYHLPFDQQYDVTKIQNPGEFYAMTVKEAVDAGFRRAFKWFGSN